MLRMPYELPTLLIVGCGGLAASSLGDARTDDKHAPTSDSSSIDATTYHATDAGTDKEAHEAAIDAPACTTDDAATGWSVVMIPTNDFSAVWGSTSSDVWAVGGGILHWDGVGWWPSPLPTKDSGRPAPTYLDGVWGSGSKDVWAVGYGGPLETRTEGGWACCTPTSEILHWNGSAWSVSLLTTVGTLNGVWGSGPSDVWAVGVDESSGGVEGEIRHWDRSTWSVFPHPPTSTLRSVWGSSPTDVWAVGDGGVTVGNGILHWDGSAWSSVTSVWGLSGVWGSGASDVWAVGREILHSDGDGWPFNASFSGLNAVWGSGRCDVWAVGNGAILHHS